MTTIGPDESDGPLLVTCSVQTSCSARGRVAAVRLDDREVGLAHEVGRLGVGVVAEVGVGGGAVTVAVLSIRPVTELAHVDRDLHDGVAVDRAAGVGSERAGKVARDGLRGRRAGPACHDVGRGHVRQPGGQGVRDRTGDRGVRRADVVHGEAVGRLTAGDDGTDVGLLDRQVGQHRGRTAVGVGVVARDGVGRGAGDGRGVHDGGRLARRHRDHDGDLRSRLTGREVGRALAGDRARPRVCTPSRSRTRSRRWCRSAGRRPRVIGPRETDGPLLTTSSVYVAS